MLASGENLIELILDASEGSSTRFAKVKPSHKTTAPWAPPVAKIKSSGEKSTAVIGPKCGSMEASSPDFRCLESQPSVKTNDKRIAVTIEKWRLLFIFIIP